MPFDMFNDLLQTIKDSPVSTLFEKGEEFRRRLLMVAVVLLVFFSAFFYFSKEMIEYLKEPLLASLPANNAHIYFQGPMEGFMVMIKISLLGAIVLTLPMAIWQVVKFIEPALADEHKSLLRPFFTSALALFFAGSLFCYYVVLPSALSFLVAMGQDLAEPMLMIGDYISVLGWMLLGFGLVFQLPIVLILLAQLDLISAALLRKSRSFAVVVNLIVAAVLTPTPDPFSQIAMAIPMCLLYEVAILVIARMEKKALAANSLHLNAPSTSASDSSITKSSP